MAYYSGSASDFDALRTALVAACVAEGWTWADGILSKGAAYVMPYVSSSLTNTEGPGLIIQGGTGKSGGSLVEPSACRPRLGRLSSNSGTPDIVWPVEYGIHVMSDPDEVYLIVRSGVDRYLFLAFGMSSMALPGTGLWLSGCARRGYGTSAGAGWHGWSIEPTQAQMPNLNSEQMGLSTGFFWASSRSSNQSMNLDTIHSGFDGQGWSGSGTLSAQGAFNAIYAAAPAVARSPNAWNAESILIPIKGHVWRPSSKCSMAVEVGHARYVRIDNYEPGQIINLGPDRWRIYPFYLKNSAVRNGGNLVLHTGTFGWAIRYDGP